MTDKSQDMEYYYVVTTTETFNNIPEVMATFVVAATNGLLLEMIKQGVYEPFVPFGIKISYDYSFGSGEGSEEEIPPHTRIIAEAIRKADGSWVR